MWGVESRSSLSCSTSFSTARTREEEIFLCTARVGEPMPSPLVPLCVSRQHCRWVSVQWRCTLVYTFLIHCLCTLRFICICECPCVVSVIINYLPLSMASSLLYWEPLSIMVHLPGWNRTSSLKKYLSLQELLPEAEDLCYSSNHLVNSPFPRKLSQLLGFPTL